MEILARVRAKIKELEEKRVRHNFEEDSVEAKILRELKSVEENFDNDEDKVKAIMEMKARDPNYNWIDVKQI